MSMHIASLVKICPLAIPNQIFLMSIYIASLVKVPCYLLKLLSENENIGVSWADFDEILVWLKFAQ